MAPSSLDWWLRSRGPRFPDAAFAFTPVPSRDIVAHCMVHGSESCPVALRADQIYNIQGCEDTNGEHAVCTVGCNMRP